MKINNFLDDYQKTAIKEAYKQKKMLIGLDTGLGKTLFALEISKILLDEKKIKRCLFVTKKGLLKNTFQKEQAKFNSQFKANYNYEIINLHPLTTKKNKYNLLFDELQKKNKIFMINYEQFRLNINLFKSFIDLVVIDEAHKLQSHISKLSISTRFFSHSLKYMFFMSATLTPKSQIDLYTMLYCVDYDNFKSFNSFVDEFFEVKEIKFNRFKKKKIYSLKVDKEVFYNSFQEKAFLKDNYEVMKDIPPIQKHFIFLDMSFSQAVKYKKLSSEIKAFSKREIKKELCEYDPNNSFLNLRYSLSGIYKKNDGSLVYLRENPKLNKTLEIIEKHKKEKIIIWVRHKIEIKLLTKFIKNSLEVHGGNKEKVNNENIEKFEKSKTHNILIVTYDKFSDGYNMQFSHISIFFSTHERYDRLYQALSRQYRRGQKNACQHYYLYLKCQFEYKLSGILERKKSLNTSNYKHLSRNI